MKRILLFLFIGLMHFSMAQNFNYSQKWKEIEQLSKNGEDKSILPKINQIYYQAKKENNTSEIINSLIYQFQIISQTQEDKDHDTYKITIQNIEQELNSFKGVTLPIMQSLLANIYYEYMTKTRWERQNITDTETLSNDISTWSSKKLLQKSLNLYKESVSNKEILRKERTENWKNILTAVEDITLYPTLYDVLVQRYITALTDRYSGMEVNYLENKNDASEFIKINIDSIIEVQISDLLEFHKNDADKSSFLNFKLMQILQFSNRGVKTEQIAEQIIKLAQSYPEQKYSAYLTYLAAKQFIDSDKKKSFDICNNVVYSQDNLWSINCKSLREELQKVSIQTSVDEVLLPNENIPLSIKATNINKVYYRIYEVTPEHYSQISSKNSVVSTTGIFSNTHKKLIKNGILELKKFQDYTSHSTLVKLDGLPQGNYVIEFSNNPDFTPIKEGTSNRFGSTLFMVHDWTIVDIGGNNKPLFQLISRKTGKVIANQSLTIFRKLNNNGKDMKILSDPIHIKTDVNGIFDLTDIKNIRNNFSYVFNPESKSFIHLPLRYYGSHYWGDKTNDESSFFTDRSIYRPGQKIYFKVLLYRKNKDKVAVAKNQKVTITLHNVNGEKISSLELVSNDYGSVFGEFILPQRGVTGNYYLTSSFGSANRFFSVEEYKRPNFEVNMDRLVGEYILDKEVEIEGRAISYAGVPISEAKVVYRVEREVIFPFYRGYFPIYQSNPETITLGESKTDKEGKFIVSFIAKSKDVRKEKEYRTYTYIVYADVTDINGETHSVQESVTIGDLPKKLTLQIPETSTQKDFTKICINSTNLNDVKIPSEGKITITKLSSPTRIILPNKTTSVPDYQLYDEETYNRYFPHLPYSKEEQNPQLWKKVSSVNYNFDTKKSDTLILSSKLSKGFYLVEAFTLYEKDSVKTQKIIEIRDDKTQKSTDNLFYSVLPSKTAYKVGEKIEINFFSDFKEATAILHLESGSKWILHKEIPIKNGKGTYSLIATKDFLTEGLFASTYLIKENGYTLKNFSINVIAEPKDLKITTKVFRDKITPGVKEKWKLTVTGKDKDKITAEVLATMYDASLDQFQSNSYSFLPWEYTPYGILYQSTAILDYGFNVEKKVFPYDSHFSYEIPRAINLKDFIIYYNYGGINSDILLKSGTPKNNMPAVASASSPILELKENVITNDSQYSNISIQGERVSGMENTPQKDIKEVSKLSQIQARTNLQETVFYYPSLYTDENGDVTLNFTSPEALTKWKLLLLAHTQDLKAGTAEYYSQTQKDLMVVPNVPRFLREGDEITISTKINNLSNKKLSGKAQLFLFDAVTNKPVDTNFKNTSAVVSFQTESTKNTEVSWSVKVPENIQAVTYRIVAKAGNFSDGEENILPILTNRMLVTETLPINIKENQTKEYRLDKLINYNSTSLQNFNLSLEMTTNPIWLAVFSLPYLREYPYECSEQLFSRLYGNILSTYIVNSSPKIKRVFDNWNAKNSNISNLEKNQELKNILIEETPWVQNAENETEQKKRIALLFDLNKMSQENTWAQDKLIKRQNSDGGFAWFEGGYSSPYITESIILGFGQLKNMLGNQASFYLNSKLDNVISKAIQYADNQTIQYIKELKKNNSKINGKSLIHYYYVRSFWKDQYQLPAEISKHLVDINKNILNYFKNYDLQNKAMTAVVLYRYGYKSSAQTVIRNLKETSVETDEMGMYWKDNIAGWNWYQTPVESQAKVIEAFSEVTPADVKSVEEMKIWLLKNRQTRSWNSTKATTNAIYALINFGKDWSDSEGKIDVFVGDNQYFLSEASSVEQASGYSKISWNSDQIKSEMGSVKIKKTTPGVAWGGLYWQYFEDLNKITKANTNVKIQKQLFLKVNTDRGQQLQEITDHTFIKVGDLITVKLILKVDRDMDYIHIKDMRASGFEPVNVLSGYKYQNGSGYYESTRDAATDFFFERVQKGTYVFEYEVRANNKGEFSNGITQFQSMYAPEMSAHSEGIKVIIK